MTKQTISVSGMTCAACANTIEKNLKKELGVKSVQASFATDSVYVEFDENIFPVEKIERSIQGLGYVIGEGKKNTKKDQILSDEMVLILSLFSSLLMMFISMGPISIPHKEYILLVMSAPIVFGAGRGFFSRAIKQAKNLSTNMDTLVALGAFTAFFYSLLLTVFPTYFQEVNNGYYYEASAMIISLILVGKYLEKRAKTKTSNAIQKLLQLNPSTTTVILNGEEVEMAIEDIQKGYRIQIRPGEKIPVDGRVVRGESTIDESMLTGEPVPVYKERGEVLFAGTLNQEGAFMMIADKVGKDTFLSSIIEMVKNAQGSKAPIQKLADRISSVFVPTVISLATLAFVIWFFIMGESFAFALSTFVTTLIISCPCALGLATPTAVSVGIGLGAENGILFKDAESLQKLREVDSIVFDKTGTLTKGVPVVKSIDWESNIKSDDISTLLDVIFSIEKQSEHPYGKAIVSFLEGKSNELILDQFKVVVGKGVKAEYKGDYYLIGNKRLFEEYRISYANYDSASIFIAKNDHIIGTVSVEDEIRQESKVLVSELKSLDKAQWMLTGDSRQNAEIIANKIGLDQIVAEVLPQEKLSFIEKLQEQKKVVAMVGDGLNDAPSLAQADVGISLSSGTDIAIETASISMMHGDISKLPYAFRISEESMSTVKQNLFFAFLYNSIAIPIAMGLLYLPIGYIISPMIGALAMSLSSISVVSNSLRFKYKLKQN
ncbi:Cu2+-exporting ATPase [Sediminitomix flava]|uniref:Cu2+-exporting ATPase n=2 Tax=Sediminitomix flava TaxID=379075 RepID=A0A315ZBR9_SEDFL|nr:Cu2+-exporting ATPase [Sediminitomix flava]